MTLIANAKIGWFESHRKQKLFFTFYHGRRVCKAHLGTCLGKTNWGSLFEAPRGTAKKLNITCFRI